MISGSILIGRPIFFGVDAPWQNRPVVEQPRGDDAPWPICPRGRSVPRADDESLTPRGEVRRPELRVRSLMVSRPAKFLDKTTVLSILCKPLNFSVLSSQGKPLYFPVV